MGEAVALVRVDPRFPGVWERLSPYLERALEHGGDKDWALPDVLHAAVAGTVQLWAFIRGDEVFGSGVTCESFYPRRKVVEVLLMGADAHTDDDWAHCVEQLKSMAKAFGASTLTGTGRPGWARKLGADRERRVWEIDL